MMKITMNGYSVNTPDVNAFHQLNQHVDYYQLKINSHSPVQSKFKKKFESTVELAEREAGILN